MSMTSDASAVSVSSTTKRYGQVLALDDVSLALRAGTVHGLVGENGSGKSTLTKIIAGVIAPDQGTVSFHGVPVQGGSPRESIQQGVRVIFQDLSLFPNMSVAQNLSFEGNRKLLRPVAHREMMRQAQQTLDDLGLDIDPRSTVGDLSTAQRQFVAIARAVAADGRIILMDEPTASLTHHEIDDLLAAVRRLSEQGLSFLFISHKLREVVSIADDVTVLRDGQVVSTGPSEDYDQERITDLMTGGLVETSDRSSRTVSGSEPVLQARALTLPSSFHDIDLDLHRGRILGLAGLVGSGRTEIGLALSGLVPFTSGEVLVGGRRATDLRRDESIQLVPDDRLTEGLFLGWSIAENIVLNSLNSLAGSGASISEREIVERAEHWRQELRIKAPDVTASVSTLSGGNQQRVLLARALAVEPDVLVLNNPTVGVDIGSRAEIHDLIRQAADRGMSILLISDEPAELLSLCDDVHVIVDGRTADRRTTSSLSEDDILELISREAAA